MSTETEALSKTEALETIKRQQSLASSSDPQRFTHGVLIRGKLIGVEDVKEETGDEICQMSMVKLKAVVIAKKEHKQRICVKINLEGLEIVDEKTNLSIYKHSVNRISYIARDVNDSRAIGYIYKNSANSFQYFAIKTERAAQELFNTLKDLFEAVLEMRKNKKTENADATLATIPEAASTTPTPTINSQPVVASLVDAVPAQVVSPPPPTNDNLLFGDLDLGEYKNIFYILLHC